MPFIFLSMLVTISSALGAVERSDSGIHGPSYQTILDWQASLASAYPTLVEVIDYGKSRRGRQLRMMVVMDRTVRPLQRKALVMTGSIHGNEYLNIEDRLPAEILGRASTGPVNDFLRSGGVYVFVPIANPDGYESRSRYNARGVDLNRDWDVPTTGFKGFEEPESRLLALALADLKRRENLELAVTVDYHCCAGALLTPWSYTEADMQEPALTYHREIGELANRHLQVEVGATGQVLGYTPLGTSKDYYFSNYGALSFTYEGRYGQERQRLGDHVKWWDDIAAYVDNQVLESFAFDLVHLSLRGVNYLLE